MNAPKTLFLLLRFQSSHSEEQVTEQKRLVGCGVLGLYEEILPITGTFLDPEHHIHEENDDPADERLDEEMATVLLKKNILPDVSNIVRNLTSLK